MRFSYKYQYFKICHTSLTGFGWYLLAKYMAALKLLPTASFKYRDCDREALERKMLKHRHIVVSGWFARWYDLFLKYRDEICDLFTLDEQYTAPVKAKMQEAEAPSSLTSPLKTIHVYLSTNDSQVTADAYQQLCPKVAVHHLQGSAPEDLFMLSECDYVIGPPSTFSLVAAMYRDIPLYRMDTADAAQMMEEGYKRFAYWFQNMV